MLSINNGTTRVYGLIGDPLKTAKSPRLFNRLFAAANVDAVCVPMEVAGDGLDTFLGGLRSMRNLSGLLVTMPYKQRLLDVVDELHPTSRLTGAINVVRCSPDGRWVGAVFDGLGWVLGLQHHDVSLRGASVLLIGAGGSGRAIAFAVAEAGARALTIADLDRQRAAELAQAVACAYACDCRTGSADPAGYAIVINATPLGMSPADPLPLDVTRLDASTVIVDNVTRSQPTELLIQAKARGCLTLDGEPMHIGQATLALRFLEGERVAERLTRHL